MTRTEDRLADALRASAAQVDDSRLHPLPGLVSGPGTASRSNGRPPGGQPPGGRSQGEGRGWLVPAAAAVSVALVIGLVLALTGGPRHHASGPSAGRGGNASITTPPPKYFMQLVGASQVGATVTIRSVTSHAVITSAAAPRLAGWTLGPYAMAAAPDGRTFYIAYDATAAGAVGNPPDRAQIWIYQLRITDSRLVRVPGGVLTSVSYFGIRGSMAVSPDGTKLVLTQPTPVRGYQGPGSIDAIVVIDLRTREHFTWQGGLAPASLVLLIPDVSWTADGRSLVFPAVFCDRAIGLNLCEEASGPANSRMQLILSIPVATGGGSLRINRSKVLLSAGPVITHAIAGPRPGELTLVMLSGRKTTAGFWPVATVQRVKVDSGIVLSTEYRLVTGRGEQPPRDIGLGADPSGQHLLLTVGIQGGFVTGRIGDGKIRLLPLPRQPYSGYPIVAW